MKTLSALLATAATASILGMSSAAQAMLCINGLYANGINANGIVLQGEQANGLRLNGKTPQGIFVNGIGVRGTRSSVLNAGSPGGGRLDGSARDDAAALSEGRAAASFDSGLPRIESIRIGRDILHLR